MSKALRILAVGAAGSFAGLVVPALAKRGVQVVGLIHRAEDEAKARRHGAAEIAVADISDPTAVASALRGVDATFYIAPVALQHEAAVGRQYVQLAKDAGVRRIVFSSVIHPNLSELENHAAKAPVEEAILESGLEYALLQPAVFFQTMAAGWIQAQKTGVYSEPWANESRFSRVDYRDVAEVATIALTEDRLLYGTFELATDGALNRIEVAALMSDVCHRPIRAEKSPRPESGQVPDQLLRMMDWYDSHSLLGNATTLRAILGGKTRSLRSYLSELRTDTPV